MATESKGKRPRSKDYDRLARLRFIDDELFWSGQITRRRIAERFGVSEETAKADIRAYRRGPGSDLAPGGRDHVYRVPIDFTPRLGPASTSEDYLAGLLEDDGAGIAVGVVPDVDRRRIDRIVLQSVVRAIREGDEIKVYYRSPRIAEARIYWILPHALVHDGFRWAVRCYYHRDEGGYWGEMVLDRIEEVAAERRRADPALRDADEHWHTQVEIALVPNPGLSPAERQLIEAQYGMVDGRKVIRVRRCLLVYFLKRYQLEEPATFKAPHQAPLVIAEPAAAAAAILPAMRVPLGETEAAAPRLLRALRERLPGTSDQSILEQALGALLDRLGGSA
jgi:predicted DNA-binding transcriptional regulator YafY